MPAAATRRTYHSPRRAEQARATKDALVAAAARLFPEQGWAATGMRDIAREAGVATETIYSHFPSKADLLRRVVEVSIVGDDDAVPVAERPEFQAVGQGDRQARIAAAARLLVGIHTRIGTLFRVLREAAPGDEAAAETLRAFRDQERRDVAAGLALVMGRSPTDEERDGAWAVMTPDVYLLLVEEAGWSAERYEAWMTATLDALVPAS